MRAACMWLSAVAAVGLAGVELRKPSANEL